MLSATSTPQAQPQGDPVRSQIVQNGRKRVNLTWPDAECVEEYDVRSDELLVRKWRRKTPLGGFTDWATEVGELERTVITAGQTLAGADVLLRESAAGPFIVRKDSATQFLWRIRNLTWPKSNYSVTVEQDRIVVRTANRKYFTRIPVPDMQRACIPLDEKAVKFDWANGTLVISYDKPRPIIEREHKERLERNAADSKNPPKEGDVQCPQS